MSGFNNQSTSLIKYLLNQAPLKFSMLCSIIGDWKLRATVISMSASLLLAEYGIELMESPPPDPLLLSSPILSSKQEEGEDEEDQLKIETKMQLWLSWFCKELSYFWSIKPSTIRHDPFSRNPTTDVVNDKAEVGVLEAEEGGEAELERWWDGVASCVEIVTMIITWNIGDKKKEDENRVQTLWENVKPIMPYLKESLEALPSYQLSGKGKMKTDLKSGIAICTHGLKKTIIQLFANLALVSREMQDHVRELKMIPLIMGQCTFDENNPCLFSLFTIINLF